MAILSKNKKSSTSASGYEYLKLSDTIFGYRKSRINKESECFTNDYIYGSSPDDSEYFEDREVGANKSFSLFHDENWCDNYKNLSSSKERREKLEFERYLEMTRTRIRLRG